MTTTTIPRCSVCGEDTTHNRASSFFGHVHRWGPTDHVFTPTATRTPDGVFSITRADTSSPDADERLARALEADARDQYRSAFLSLFSEEG